MNLNVKSIIPNPALCRSYICEEQLKQSLLFQSIEKNGVLQPLTVYSEDGKMMLLSGLRRLTCARMAGLQEVPVQEVSISAAEDVFLRLIAENLEAPYGFMDWTCLLRSLTQADLLKPFYPNLHLLTKKWKFPLKTDLVLRIFDFPKECQDAVSSEQLSWKIVYYQVYFDSDEWLKILEFFLRFRINQNTQRKILEKLIVWKERWGLSSLFDACEDCSNLKEVEAIFFQKLSPEQYLAQKNFACSLKSCGANCQNIHIRPDFERRQISVGFTYRLDEDMDEILKSLEQIRSLGAVFYD